MSVKLDEAALRRPDFRPGTPVVLADGQEWHLRAPVVIFQAWPESPAGWRATLSLLPHDDYQEELDRYNALFGGSGSASIGEMFPREYALGKRLLEANYDLDADQARTLLQFVYNDETGHPYARIRDEVMEVATGNGPKRSRDGDTSSPTTSGESASATG